jgi:hypothetical protein
METPKKKRKSTRSGSTCGPRDGDRVRRNMENNEQEQAAQGGSPDGIGRGLKRKSGCVEPAAQFGRKKNLDHYYSIGM